MVREQMISFLETMVVFLLLTNAVSAFAATYAIWVANGFAHKKQEFVEAAERRIGMLLRRAI
jgi:hypothetical protein